MVMIVTIGIIENNSNNSNNSNKIIPLMVMVIMVIIVFKNPGIHFGPRASRSASRNRMQPVSLKGAGRHDIQDHGLDLTRRSARAAIGVAPL